MTTNKDLAKKFAPLFEPIKIGPVEIKNRFAVAGIGSSYEVGALAHICWYNARALGGFGLLTVGAMHSNKAGEEEAGLDQPGLYFGAKPNMHLLKRFMDSIKSQGTDTKVFMQLSVGFGRQTFTPNAKAPSPIPLDEELAAKNEPEIHRRWQKYILGDRITKHVAPTPRAMTIEEIHQDEISFVRGVELAVQRGFDGIEIHAPHGYLLHQFLTARCNQRKDEYGGSLRNRARYLLELLAMCKERFGDDLPIMVRISGEEGPETPGGNTAEDQRQIAKWCQEYGADAIHLSNGAGHEDYNRIAGYNGQKDNYPLLEAQGKKLKKAVSIPVITVGLMTPEVALKALEDGETDMISLARQAMADPAYPNKLKEGRLDEIIRCTKDGWCTGYGLVSGTALGRNCTQNPQSGWEEFIPEYWPKPYAGRVPESVKRLAPRAAKWGPIVHKSID